MPSASCSPPKCAKRKSRAKRCVWRTRCFEKRVLQTQRFARDFRLAHFGGEQEALGIVGLAGQPGQADFPKLAAPARSPHRRASVQVALGLCIIALADGCFAAAIMPISPEVATGRI